MSLTGNAPYLLGYLVLEVRFCHFQNCRINNCEKEFKRKRPNEAKIRPYLNWFLEKKRKITIKLHIIISMKWLKIETGALGDAMIWCFSRTLPSLCPKKKQRKKRRDLNPLNSYLSRIRFSVSFSIVLPNSFYSYRDRGDDNWIGNVFPKPGGCMFDLFIKTRSTPSSGLLSTQNPFLCWTVSHLCNSFSSQLVFSHLRVEKGPKPTNSIILPSSIEFLDTRVSISLLNSLMMRVRLQCLYADFFHFTQVKESAIRLA